MWLAAPSFVPRQPSIVVGRRVFFVFLVCSVVLALFTGIAQADVQLDDTSERGGPAFQQTADVGTTIRFEGADRIHTAVAIADSLYVEANVGFIVLASSEQFPDALAGGSLAATLRGPLLLTQSTELHPLVVEAMQRYAQPGTADVVMMGGEGALSAGVERQVREAGYEVRRIAGPNRYATAAQAASSFGTPGTIYLADGDVFGDALIAAAAAGVDGAVVLTSGTRMPEETRAYLNSLPSEVSVTPIGRAAATTMPKNASIYGDSVYETSAMVATTLFPDFDTFGLASGEAFPDGLAGASHAGAQGFPLLLTERERAPDVVVEAVAEQTRELAYVYGGSAAIADEITVQIGRSNMITRCRIFSLDCTQTYSRTATRELCEDVCHLESLTVGEAVILAAPACGRTGAPVAVAACLAAVAAYFSTFFVDLLQADEQEACFQVKYYLLVGDPRSIANPTAIDDGPDCDLAGSPEEDQP